MRSTHGNLLNTELDLAERLVLVVVEVGERDLEDTALQRVVGIVETLGAVDEGLADVAVLEERRRLDVVPVLAGEGVNDLFLDSLLSLGETLVLSNRHFLLVFRPDRRAQEQSKRE